ncbi:MarR family transcriptional regulator [Salmonella enterica subsp. enterica]|nr:MarR family transcriptional regulator [Salmonella enterica subsp. enterica]
MSILAGVNRKMRTMFDARVREQGLTLSRARLLLLLAKGDGVTQRELAEALEIEQPSLVTLLDGLERQGLIVREPLETDRRANRVVLTPEARDETDRLMAQVADLRDQILEGVDPAELAAAQSVLARIGRNIGAAV